MKSNKIKLLFFITWSVLLIGIVSAGDVDTNVQPDTVSDDLTYATENVFVDADESASVVVDDVKNGEYTIIGGYYSYGNDVPLTQTTMTININGNKYYAKTDETGYFQYKYKTNKLGTNNVTVSYAGNTNFKSASVKESFMVYNLELYTYQYSAGENFKYQRIGNDNFVAFYQTYYGQNDKGVYAEVRPVNMRDMGDPANSLIFDAKFIFKDDYGYIYSDSFDSGTGNDMYHSLVSGYTPYKVLIAYRKMTDYEKYLWNNGYGYNPSTGKWYSW